MTARDRKLLGILLPFALIAAVWFLLLAPKRKDVSRLDGQVDQAHAALAEAQDEVIRYQAAEQQLSENLVALARAGRAVPAAQAIPPLLRQLQRAAQRTHVDLQVVQQGGDDSAPASTSTTTATPSADLSTYGLSLTLEGDYFQLQRYFTRLDHFIRVSQQRVEATGRLLSLSSVKLGPGAGGFPQLTANVDASIYALPDLRTMLAGAPEPATVPPTGAPSTTTASAGSPTPTATAEGVTP